MQQRFVQKCVSEDECDIREEPEEVRVAKNVEPSIEKPVRKGYWRSLKEFLFSPSYTLFVHFLITWMIVILFANALSSWWRVLRVDQQALQLLYLKGEINATELNSTLAVTRVHNVYQECLLDPDSKFDMCMC